MFFANLLIVLGLVMAVIGGGFYLVEFANGRVTMHTRWHELTHFQFDCFVLAVLGIAIFLGALIGSAILRSFA